VLMCLGELACVGGEEVDPHVPELMEIILTKLADPSIAKRDAALHALGQVCSSTGFVIQPLVEYPQLLQIFGRILKSESNSSVRREVIKVLGIIGALDPYRRKVRRVYPTTKIRNLTLYRLSPTRNRMSPKRPLQQRLISPIRHHRLRMIISRRWSSMHCSAF
jgi:phosphatidylinositol kinase/protein kinase (PI-3  family)